MSRTHSWTGKQAKIRTNRHPITSVKELTYRGYVRYVDDAYVVLGIEYIAHLHCYVPRYIHLSLILQDSIGQDRTGQVRTGQDRTGQDRTGQDRTGQDRTGQDRTGQHSIA